MRGSKIADTKTYVFDDAIVLFACSSTSMLVLLLPFSVWDVGFFRIKKVLHNKIQDGNKNCERERERERES